MSKEDITADEPTGRDVLGWEQGYKCGKAECADIIRQLARGCQAALAYLAEPPSAFRENREEAVSIIREALANWEGAK